MTPTDDLAATLGKVDLFAGLPAKVFRRFEQDGLRRTYAAGETVTHEGDKVGGFVPFSQEGVLFHVVLAGSGEVRQRRRGDRPGRPRRLLRRAVADRRRAADGRRGGRARTAWRRSR